MSSIQPPSNNDPSRAMQWVVLFIVTVLTLLILTLPIITAYVTKNLYYLVPSLGAIPLGFVWQRIASFTYPKRKEDYDLDALRIKHQP